MTKSLAVFSLLKEEVSINIDECYEFFQHIDHTELEIIPEQSDDNIRCCRVLFSDNTGLSC